MRLILLCFAFLPVLAASASEVYRWVDADGVVHYSDRPTTEQAELVAVRAPRPMTPPATIAAGQRPPADSAAEGEVFVEDEAEEAQRQANCEAASARLNQLESAPRLFRQGPDGERQFLDDEEIERLRSEARELVATWCD